MLYDNGVNWGGLFTVNKNHCHPVLRCLLLCQEEQGIGYLQSLPSIFLSKKSNTKYSFSGEKEVGGPIFMVGYS